LPGVEGATLPVTAKVRAGLLPQLLFAVTEIVPPAVLVFTVMLVVVEVPVHPEGNVQV
jgi:hypothetical protein